MFAGASFGLPRCTNFLAGVLGVHLIEHVTDSGKLAVPAYTIHAVIHRNKVDAVFREQHFRIHTHLEIIAAKSGHIFDNNPLDLSSLYIGKHPLEAGPVEIRPGVPVVLIIVADSCIAVVAAIFFQNFFLVDNTVALAL